MTSTGKAAQAPSGSSSPSDPCRLCDHMRETHVRLLGGCAMFECRCEGFKPQEPPMTPEEEEQAPEDGVCVCGVRYDAHARRARGGCRDPYEGEQGNCLHGMGPEVAPAFKPGDNVQARETGDTMILEFGPFTAWAATTSSGRSIVVNADSIQPIPPEDPRVTVAQMVLLPMIADADLRVSAARAVLAALDALEVS